ncbi:MAG: AraC family transcriptional regulator, partial [Rhodospirillaceae bacterium]|nr:AraC family transcriptional regulator [Rhodospirillaceae bacterium]
DETALPPTAWQGLQRVRRAGALLFQGEDIAAVAVDAGFYDQSHMTRQFLRLFGMTPGEYRAGAGLREADKG